MKLKECREIENAAIDYAAMLEEQIMNFAEEMGFLDSKEKLSAFCRLLGQHIGDMKDNFPEQE